MFEEKTYEQKVLEKFLNMSVRSTDEVFDAFKNIDGAIMHEDGPLRRFIYIPGTRDDRVLLVAHADTIWDKNWKQNQSNKPQTIKYKYGVYSNSDKSSECGIGADDRAGCAMLYLLKNSGHSILILDGEEHGQIGAHYLKDNFPDLFQEINQHSYALQFDRRNYNEFKCYNIPVSKEFKFSLNKNFKMHDAGKKSKTDIVVLCENMCGANLSVGYYNEHTKNECLVFREWLKSYKKVSKALKYEQERFDLKNKNKYQEELTM